MKPEIYPIEIHPDSLSGGCHGVARSIWMRARPKGLLWYAIKFVIERTTVTLVVYDMESNLWGGVGKKVHEVTFPRSDNYLTPDELAGVDKIERDAQYRAASNLYRIQKAEREAAEIEALRISIFDKE